jgi:cytochrome P450
MIRDLIWETLRRFPPVSAVPYWATDDSGLTWTRKIANVGQALQDPSVFSEPLAVRLGRPGLNHEDSQLSIGFADFATVAGNASHQDAHACPGKKLALAILEAFLQEFLVHLWEAESTDIKLDSFSTSGFTLRKVSSF